MRFRFRSWLYRYLGSQRPLVNARRPPLTLLDMSEDRDPHAHPQFVQAFDSSPEGAMRRPARSSKHRAAMFWRG
jgi:hypothetical protein